MPLTAFMPICKSAVNAPMRPEGAAMGNSAHGRCLCGKVSFTSEPVTDVGICHCAICRRWGGSPGIAAHLKQAPEISGADAITWYESSDWAERGFCSTCGSNLFYRLKGDTPQYYAMAGTYEDQSGFRLNLQIFIEEKPAYYDFAGDIPSMTGEEVFAMYADTPESKP